MTARRKPVRPRRATRRRRAAPQEDAAWWTWATIELLTRSGYRCERCGRDLGNNLERHHRQRRTVGGDRLSNLLALHSSCHAWITTHPEEAQGQGWIVPALGTPTPDPADVPVRLPGLSGSAWWLLYDDGTKRPVL